MPVTEEDFALLADQIVLLKNDNYVLRQRVRCLEHIVTWCMQYLTFVRTFSTLLFESNLPITSVIFNSDLFDIPFQLVGYTETCAKNVANYMYSVYDQLKLTKNPAVAEVIKKVHAPQSAATDFKSNIANIRSRYSVFAREFNSGSSDFRLIGPFHEVSEEVNTKLLARLEEVLTEFDVPFTPQFLLKQTLVSEILLYFSSNVFKYVPQLLVDFGKTDNMQYAVTHYIRDFVSFWDNQVNVSVGPYYFAYDRDNFNKPNQDQEWLDIFRAKNQPVDFLSVDAQVMLARLEHQSMNRRFVDPVSQDVAHVWRLHFMNATGARKEGSVVLRAINDADRAQLLAEFKKDFDAQERDLFDRAVMDRTHQLAVGGRSDLLTNVKYTFFEQCCMLKLVVRYLLQRWYADRPAFEGYDPLTDLVQLIFWHKNRTN